MKQRSSSFSIIEVIVAVALGVILMGSAYELYYLATRTLARSNSHFEIRQGARIAMERISRDLRQSEEIISDLPENIATPTAQIKFQDGHETSKIQYIEYYVKDNALYRKYTHFSFAYSTDQWVYWDTKDNNSQSPNETTDLDEIISENFVNLSIWGKSKINISITVEQNQQSETYTTTVLGRNIT